MAEGGASYKDTLSLSLPPLIVNPDDIFIRVTHTDPNLLHRKQLLLQSQLHRKR